MQRIRFTRVHGRKIAWAAVGSGPVLVMGGWWCSHLELNWRDDVFRRFLLGLADRFTVIRYDRPGTGLSDQDGPLGLDLAGEVDVLAAVVAEAGERVSLFGGSSGGCIAMAYAAAHTDTVERLALYGSYANGADIASPEARDAIVAITLNHWGAGSRLLADVFMPSGTPADREAYVRFQRAAATPQDAARSLAAVYDYDVREHLPHITMPTLVVHRRDDRAIPFALGRDLARTIPDTQFVALDGADHLPWHGDTTSITHAVTTFLGAPTPPPSVKDLSPREIEILRLVAQGLSDHEIAAHLVLSPHTVHRHVANIRTKLGLSSRSAAAAHAAKAGLI
ncbi:alpha/beta fold hydrolase [Actinocrispum sp. NPDC049592]|uniref:alpha/beta fold hydrolase n=1 Tax=Actinocrispum sp. NPDC049592 TaxID=3154835 RepID=UPI00342A6E33